MLNQKWTIPPIQKWGGLASFLLVPTVIASSLIYLTGNLRDAMGQFAYSLADFLSGPVWAAGLVAVVFTLREHIGGRAPRRMNLALLATFAAACAFVAVASIRSANRHYHLIHPELHLESSTTVLTVWTTLVAGVTGTAWHFLGWAMILIASAGWTSRLLPRTLTVLYVLAGISSLFVYLLPELEANSLAIYVVVSAWQGILFLKADPNEARASEINESKV